MSSYNSSSSSSSRCKRPRTSSLPLELHPNVLSRVPTKSLPKFRSVCKEWRDIIDDPRFATVHAASGVESPRILLFSQPSLGAEPRFVMDEEFLETSLPRLAGGLWHCGARASCHGLLCFDDLRKGETCLLNPLTRDGFSLSSVAPCERPLGSHIAIGMDRLTSRYKILRVSYFRRAIGAIRAEVLDQGSQSWREIASVPPGDILGDPVFAAGSIHWSVASRNDALSISSFDLAKEEFGPTPCPEIQHARLVDLGGALGLVDCSREESLDVWVMEERGRWKKEYSVQQIPLLPVNKHGYLSVLGCGGRKIMVNYLGSFWFYDPATDEVKHVRRATDAGGSITLSLLSPTKLWNGGVAEISAD
ncbi:F-box/kelch-repeat protein At3g23880-like [Rhodamnia argentea]|uniref:F-box/kelch-repeat protein At3g23880-like n=1 Tax=Rhodamnia argentea TaxID=178133 RepID=A0A8B8N2D5_9MYRT|nr:F-box/kelch-repeat protein At3g23880-like [Rhodamnia argentea]